MPSATFDNMIHCLIHIAHETGMYFLDLVSSSLIY